MVFAFERVPQIPPYEEGEVGIPRTNLATFDRKFLNGQPRQEIDYLYRLHPFKSSYGYSYKSLLNKGIEYRNPLDNIEKHKRHKLPYIDEIISRCVSSHDGSIVPRGMYYFASLNAALQNQYFNLSVNAHYEVDSKGIVASGSNQEDLLHNLWILTRVSVSVVPRGTFFADPNTQDSPDATLHVVDQVNGKVVFIPTSSIDVSIGREFVNASDLSEETMLDIVKSRNISLLISRILPDD